MKKISGKGIAGIVGGLGLLGLGLFSLLGKNKEEEVECKTIYDNDDESFVVDSDDTDN